MCIRDSVMLEHDPRLAGKIRLDAFADRLTAQCPLPWAHRRDCHDLVVWSDADDAGLRDYAERLLGYRTRDAIDDALMLTAAQAAYHPVREYLESLAWDGQPRLDTLLIDYLGAEDSAYTRAVTRKACVAAVARVYEPGIKYDTAIILSGPQGVGKSTVVARLGREWYTDSISDLAGKEAMELMQGQWLIELGELEALNRAELQTVKAVLTRQVDQYRAPYARRAAPHPRQCVFWGTTNSPDYLRDPTGNRRFWPVETNVQPAPYNAYHDLTDEVVGQVWAEATLRYRAGEPLVLTKALEAEAEARRARRTEQDPLQGVIEEFLARPIPEDWDRNWNDLSRRLTYWGGGVRLEKTKLVARQWVCIMEIWRECLMDNRSTIPQREANRISNILLALGDWKRAATHRFGPLYGRQRAYHRAAGTSEIKGTRPLTMRPKTVAKQAEGGNGVNG